MRKYKIAIDLCSNAFEENLSFLYSPAFNSLEEADKWYRGLELNETELSKHDLGVDVIMCVYENNALVETYLY